MTQNREGEGANAVNSEQKEAKILGLETLRTFDIFKVPRQTTPTKK